RNNCRATGWEYLGRAEQFGGLDQLVKVMYTRNTQLAKQRVIEVVWPGERAGMSQRRPLRQLRAAGLEYHESLPVCDPSPRGGKKARWRLEAFDEASDHAGMRVVGDRVDIVADLSDCFVAGGDDIAVAARTRHQRVGHTVCQRAALKQQRERAGSQRMHQRAG